MTWASPGASLSQVTTTESGGEVWAASEARQVSRWRVVWVGIRR